MKVRISRFNRRKKENVDFFSPGENNPFFTCLSTENKLIRDQKSGKSDVTQASLKGAFWIKTEPSFFCFFSVEGLKYRIELHITSIYRLLYCAVKFYFSLLLLNQKAN